MRLLTINSREWKYLAPLLPPTGGVGRPRLDDRLVLSGLLYSEACRCSLRSLPPKYGNWHSLQSRRAHWQATGLWPELLQAGAPTIARMKANYWGVIRDASLEASANDYRNSREFWGRGVMPKKPVHMRPRGRYADRR